MTWIAALALSLLAPQDTISDETGPKRILDLAASQQGGRAIDKVTLDIRLFATIFTTTESGKKRENTIQSLYEFSEGKIRSTLIESATGSVSTNGYDGKTYWHETDKGSVIYEGIEFRDDREKIDRDIQLLALLSRACLMHLFAKEIKDLKRLPDESRGSLSSHVVEGVSKAGFGDSDKVYLTRVWVEKRTHRVLGVRLTDPSGKEPTRTFCFSSFERNPEGVEVPGQIEIWVGPPDDNRMEARLAVSKFLVNAPLSKKRFAPPQ